MDLQNEAKPNTVCLGQHQIICNSEIKAENHHIFLEKVTTIN